MQKIKNEIFFAVALIVCYALLLWVALRYMPFDDAPTWFKTLFEPKWRGVLIWIKIRHTAVVLTVAVPIASAIIKLFKAKKLLVGAIIGMSMAISSEVINFSFSLQFQLSKDVASYISMRVHDSIIPLWVPLSDFLVIAGAIPLFVWLITQYTAMNTKAIDPAGDKRGLI